MPTAKCHTHFMSGCDVNFCMVPQPRVTMDLEKGEKTRKKRYSRKKKKNLRKFTDVADIKEYLEERSRDERTG